MKSKLIADEKVKTFVTVFDAGDEAAAGLKQFAKDNNLSATSFKAVGAFERATLGWFNLETKEYEKIQIDEQVELLSMIGDVATDDKGEPQVHAHCVVEKRDGTACGGHLLEAIVRPTLEVVLTENPTFLRKTFCEEFGIALIDLDKPAECENKKSGTKTFDGRRVNMNINYVRYTDAVEQIQPDEQKSFAEIGYLMRDIVTKVGARQRHVVRSVHAKSHGLLKAKMTVKDDLPEYLRQGLFTEPGATYDAIMRFSTNPGDILSDHISSPRGLAIKFLGVSGEKTANYQNGTSQDLVMQNAKAFEARDAAAFLKNLQMLDKHADDSEFSKQVVSSTARVVETALEAVGTESATLRGFGHPATHPLGETYSTLVAHRYGGYFGKIEVVPVSENLKELCGEKLPDVSRRDGLKEVIREFFESNQGMWEVRVQLCTDLEKMPVEDASAEWDEEESPFLTVAMIVAEPQDSYSDARRVFVDEKMSFSPWHALAAHRPLGNIMRSRLKVYEDIANYRRRAEGREMIEPQSINELPD